MTKIPLLYKNVFVSHMTLLHVIKNSLVPYMTWCTITVLYLDTLVNFSNKVFLIHVNEALKFIQII